VGVRVLWMFLVCKGAVRMLFVCFRVVRVFSVVVLDVLSMLGYC